MLQDGRDLFGDPRHHAERRAEDDEIGAGRRLRRGVGDDIDEIDLSRTVAHGGIGVGADDGCGEVLRAGDAADRGADQPQADDDELLDKRLRQRHAQRTRHVR